MSSADAPAAKKAKKTSQIIVSELFPLTPEVDVFVRTRFAGFRLTKVKLFGTTKLYLQAASTVFRDTLAIATPGETHQSIPIIDIEEDSVVAELFLLHVHPGKLVLQNGSPRPLTPYVSPFAVHGAAQSSDGREIRRSPRT